MTFQDHNAPLEEPVRAILQTIAPGSTLFAIRPLGRSGVFTNRSYLVEANSPSGTQMCIVIRRYVTRNSPQRARVEFKTLELVQEHGIPVPEPLYLDEQGVLLDRPSIMTRHVPGRLIMPPLPPLPADPLQWACEMAKMLAKIHTIPCDATAKSFLPDANSNAVWFLRSGTVPNYMRARPEGTAVWQAIHDLLPAIQSVEPALVHLDYSPHNILWDGGWISAVLDWEDAGYGDPGIDVAYCYMHLFLSGMSGAADEFLRAYEVETERPVANLGFWGLAAATRPMSDPLRWMLVSKALSQFIENARQKAGY
jgi:aminoglycoside phosphotransferase (APT) family kinase protein